MAWTGGTPAEHIPTVAHLVDVYDAISTRLSAIDRTWNDVSGSGDPGSPTQERGWLDWNQYRDAVQGMCPDFANWSTLNPWTFAGAGGLAQAVLGNPTWRNAPMPHIPHVTYDLLDMEAILGGLLYPRSQTPGSLDNGPDHVQYYGSMIFSGQEDPGQGETWEDVWDTAREATPWDGFPSTPQGTVGGHTGIDIKLLWVPTEGRHLKHVALSSLHWQWGDLALWGNPQPDWSRGTAFKIRLVGRRIGYCSDPIEYEGFLEGGSSQPVWGAGNPGSMPTLGSIGDSGDYDVILPLGTYSRYMRLVHEHWDAQDIPDGIDQDCLDNNGWAEQTFETSARIMAMQVAFSPF